MLRVRVTSAGWNGGPGLNTFYFMGTETGEHADSVAVRVHAVVSAAASAFSSTVSHTVVPDVDIIDAVTGDLTGTYSTSPTGPIMGAQAPGASLPPANAILLTLHTGTFSDGSRIQGRAYWSPIARLFTDPDGTPEAGAIAAITAAGVALLDSGLAPADACVWRRPRPAGTGKGGLLPARAGMSALITGTSVADKFAVLRSRRD